MDVEDDDYGTWRLLLFLLLLFGALGALVGEAIVEAAGAEPDGCADLKAGLSCTRGENADVCVFQVLNLSSVTSQHAYGRFWTDHADVVRWESEPAALVSMTHGEVSWDIGSVGPYQAAILSVWVEPELCTDQSATAIIDFLPGQDPDMSNNVATFEQDRRCVFVPALMIED